MENDDAMVGAILNRREALASIGRCGLGAVVGGFLFSRADRAEAAFQEKVRGEVKLVASPVLTEGPFFVDEKLKRANLLADTKRPSVVQGLPLELSLTLYRLTGGKFAPLSGATVDVWHADALGVYSDENVPMNHENTAGQRWLRGYQVSDRNGLVRFQTIFPGWYEGRTTHIHFKVRQSVKSAEGAEGTTGAVGQADQTKEFTSQLFFDDAVADRIFAKAPYRVRDADQARNASDNIFGEQVSDGSRAGEHLTLTLKPGASGGYRSSLSVALTDENLQKAGSRGRGPGGPPPDGFGGPPPGGPDGPPPFGPPPDA